MVFNKRRFAKIPRIFIHRYKRFQHLFAFVGNDFDNFSVFKAEAEVFDALSAKDQWP